MKGGVTPHSTPLRGVKPLQVSKTSAGENVQYENVPEALALISKLKIAEERLENTCTSFMQGSKQMRNELVRTRAELVCFIDVCCSNISTSVSCAFFCFKGWLRQYKKHADQTVLEWSAALVVDGCVQFCTNGDAFV